MSSYDRRSICSRILVAACLAATLFLPGCQVRPLYASASKAGPALDSVAVDPVSTRVAQQVRNHLIFLLHGGTSEPVKPVYRVTLAATSAAIGVFINTSSDRPRAGNFKVTVAYTLTNTKTNKVLKRGTRAAVAAYDLPTQEFAKIRSTRDAENRAATAAAELVRSDLAGFLAR